MRSECFTLRAGGAGCRCFFPGASTFPPLRLPAAFVDRVGDAGFFAFAVFDPFGAVAALPRAAASPSCFKRPAAPSRIRLTCSWRAGTSIHPSAFVCTVPTHRPNCSANATTRCSIASDEVAEVLGFEVAVGRSMHSPFDFRHTDGRRHATHRSCRPTLGGCATPVERSRRGVPWVPVHART